MSISRREFCALCTAAAAGCAGSSDRPLTLRETSIDAGPVTDYGADGVYGQFRARGFFVIRRGAQLEALSSICTHRRCKVLGEPDGSFYCKCHGSTFDPAGRVTEGPATVNLPVLPTSIDERMHLMIHAIDAG